uniref:HEN1 double-stranded RNA binding domain-containing protein n=1 Tax=Zea mays TaxID=4577 RepID=A0A804QER2_MAIZE
MSRDSILAAELPSAYSRFSWKGLSPRDLLCSFCRLQRLPEPHFDVSRVSCDTLMSALSSEERGAPAGSAENQYTNDVRINKEKPDLFKCEVNIRSRKQEILLEYSAADTWSKESNAIQNSSLKVLIWFNNYFKKLTSKTGKLYLSESTAGVKVHSNIFLQEFAMCLPVYGKNGGSYSAMCSAVGSFSMDTQKKHLESTAKLTRIEGPDSGVFPSHGSLTCISYTASLVTKDKAKTYLLESHNEFEFEIGTGAVSNQLESCVTQLSVNQTARFVAELPPRDLIMAASCEFSHDLSNVSSGEPPKLLILFQQSF